ncbi:STAS domain-containing protein [Pseudonocardia pini]|uniref:STAS domain-containing protein n=1 Tax=Pseudonocardia pini TaxID=2758030 RepID=UPI0015F060B2|nr:STAS domain-containing protein [Pseudonocardia pini]
MSHCPYEPDAAPRSPSAADEDPPFGVVVERRGRAVVVHVSGEIDALTIDRVDAALSTVTPGGLLVVDLTEVRFLGSVGLAALVAARNRAGRQGADTRVVVGDNRVVLRPLELSGLQDEFALFADTEQALG